MALRVKDHTQNYSLCSCFCSLWLLSEKHVYLFVLAMICLNVTEMSSNVQEIHLLFSHTLRRMYFLHVMQACQKIGPGQFIRELTLTCIVHNATYQDNHCMASTDFIWDDA